MSSSEGADNPQNNLPLEPSSVEPTLPPVVPPKTTAPFQFNQVNIQPIPPKVWDKLSAEQIVELTRTILTEADKVDKRHYDFAMERMKHSGRMSLQAAVVGGIVAVVGIGAATYLSSHGNGIVGGIIATFLATILAVIIGNRFLQS